MPSVYALAAFAALSLSQLPPTRLGHDNLLTVQSELVPRSKGKDARLWACVAKAIPESNIPEGFWIFNVNQGHVSGEELPFVLPCLQQHATRRSGRVIISIKRAKGLNQGERDSTPFATPVSIPQSPTPEAITLPVVQAFESIGFPVTDTKPGNIFALLSLEKGDVIRKIDGYDINGLEDLLFRFNHRVDKKKISIDFLRNNEPIHVDLILP